MSSELPPPPASADFSGHVNAFGLYRNDEIGDCAIAAPANQIRVWSSAATAQRDLSQDDVEKAYGWAGGYPDTDDGCVISDVLAGWSNPVVGIGGDVLTAFAEIEHADTDMLKRAIATFGGAILGLSLPIAAQAWASEPSWPDVGDTLGGNLAPGSWGGHCVAAIGYDESSCWISTWGARVCVPWGTMRAYVEEAWACISADFLGVGGFAPTGLDLPRMQLDLAAMRDLT
jgi:hypothetical protein